MSLFERFGRLVGLTALNFLVNYLTFSLFNLIVQVVDPRQKVAAALAVGFVEALVVDFRGPSARYLELREKRRRNGPYAMMCVQRGWSFGTCLAVCCGGHFMLFAIAFSLLMVAVSFGPIPFAVLPWTLGLIGAVQLMTIMALIGDHRAWNRGAVLEPAVPSA